MEARDLLREASSPFELALRIRHPSIDPTAISRELRMQPEHSFKAGDPRESSSGIAATSVHAESYWLATLQPEQWLAEPFSGIEFPGTGRSTAVRERVRTLFSQQLGMALTLVATHLLRTHADFLRKVQTEGGDVGLIVELPTAQAQSFTLTPQVAKILCELGVSVDFEFTSD